MDASNLRRQYLTEMYDFSPREYDVFYLLAAEAFTNGAIAEKLQMSPKTVEEHVDTIYRKLELVGDAYKERNKRVAATSIFWNRGL